jgi:general secretion pathway protein H
MSLDWRARTERSAGGFTLLELLVVLGILAIATILAIPLGSQRHSISSLRGAALELAATLRATRAAAIRSNAERTFTFDVVARQYWAEDLEARHRVPDQLVAAIAIPGVEHTGSGVGLFRFYPDGTSSGGQIILRQGGMTAVVAVDWLTGNAQINEGP